MKHTLKNTTKHTFQNLDIPENVVSQKIIGAAIEVHRTLGGPGLLESVYEEALVVELQRRGVKVERQKAVPVVYKSEVISSPLRVDLIVSDLVIMECKAVTSYSPIFESQLLTYLRLTNLRLGLVVNFGEGLIKNGIRRVANGLPN